MRQQPAQTPLLAHHGAAKGIGGPTHPESGGFVVRVKGGTEGHGRPLEPQTAPPQSNGWEQRKMREEDMPASTQSMCKDISGFSLQVHIGSLEVACCLLICLHNACSSASMAQSLMLNIVGWLQQT